jgi:hypothetical protein
MHSRVHPAYRPDSRITVAFCDAAIIRVDRPFIFNEFVKKVKLPPHGYDPAGIASKQNRFSGHRLIGSLWDREKLIPITN